MAAGKAGSAHGWPACAVTAGKALRGSTSGKRSTSRLSSSWRAVQNVVLVRHGRVYDARWLPGSPLAARPTLHHRCVPWQICSQQRLRDGTGLRVRRTLVHGLDSPESAARELAACLTGLIRLLPALRPAPCMWLCSRGGSTCIFRGIRACEADPEVLGARLGGRAWAWASCGRGRGSGRILAAAAANSRKLPVPSHRFPFTSTVGSRIHRRSHWMARWRATLAGCAHPADLNSSEAFEAAGYRGIADASVCHERFDLRVSVSPDVPRVSAKLLIEDRLRPKEFRRLVVRNARGRVGRMAGIPACEVVGRG
jgi:hypothetical protein